MPKKCPHCEAVVKSLAQHIKRKHPEKLPDLTPEPEPETENEDLDLEVPEGTKPGEQGYHCVDCGGEVTKGTTPCPGCGHTLDWSQIS